MSMRLPQVSTPGDYGDVSSQYFIWGTPIGKSSPLIFNSSEFYVVKIDRNGGF